MKIKVFTAICLIFLIAVVFGAVFYGMRYVGVSFPGLNFAAIFSSYFPAESKINVAITPYPVIPYEPFELSWTHENKEGEGLYLLRYDCRDNFELQYASTSIPCNSLYPLENKNSMIFTAVWKEKSALDIPFVINFISNSADKISVSKNAVLAISSKIEETIIVPPSVTAPPPAPKPKDTDYSGITKVEPTGQPDLEIKIINSGSLNTVTQEFTPGASVMRDRSAAVVFDVQNIGKNYSGEWKFSAKLPIPQSDYISSVQQSLAPGDRIRFTIGFGELVNSGINTATFTVDSELAVNDLDRANNSATATVTRGY